MSAQELAELELRRIMSESPPPRDNSEGDNHDEVDELDQDSDEPGPSGIITTSTNLELTTSAILRREIASARRRADQMKLHPYQRNLIEEIIKVFSFFFPFESVNICAHAFAGLSGVSYIYSFYSFMFYQEPGCST